MSVRPGQILDGFIWQRIRDREAIALHVFRQRNHHRTGPPTGRDMKRMRDDFRNARRIVDFRHSTWRCCQTPRDNRFPGMPRGRACRARPDRRTESAALNPAARYAVPATHWLRPARASHKADARPARRLADGFRHHCRTALLPADGDFQRAIVKCHRAPRDSFRPARRTHARRREQ